MYEIHRDRKNYSLTLIADTGEYPIGTYRTVEAAKAAAQADKGKTVRWTECGGLSSWWEGR